MQPFFKSSFWGHLGQTSWIEAVGSLTRPETQVLAGPYVPASS